jgi:hypothetical protein
MDIGSMNFYEHPWTAMNKGCLLSARSFMGAWISHELSMNYVMFMTFEWSVHEQAGLKPVVNFVHSRPSSIVPGADQGYSDVSWRADAISGTVLLKVHEAVRPTRVVLVLKRGKGSGVPLVTCANTYWVFGGRNRMLHYSINSSLEPL